MNDHFLILLLALIIDALFGEPAWLYNRVPHPVALAGRLIAAADRRYNVATESERTRYSRGLLLTLAITVAAAAAGWLAVSALANLPGSWMVEAFLASTLIAARSLYDHVAAVAHALGVSVEDARSAVGHIVGRDPQSLDEAAIARAAVESTAENFCDGVVAPVFWFALLGLPGLCAYKAINTLDSMIAYRNSRYEMFGKAAARLDDAVNWLPARLAGLYLCAAATLAPDASLRRAIAIMLRDARKHRSPNAGWPESAVAGALGFALAGPRRYHDRTVDDAWMGDGRRELGAADVHSTLRLYLSAAVLLVVTVGTAWLL